LILGEGVVEKRAFRISGFWMLLICLVLTAGLLRFADLRIGAGLTR
jgi:hypothetical protein